MSTLHEDMDRLNMALLRLYVVALYRPLSRLLRRWYR